MGSMRAATAVQRDRPRCSSSAAVDFVLKRRGVAVHESFNSYVAQVAEVTVKPDGSVKVDRIVCAVDCGIVVNSDNVRSQVEGSVGFALSAAF